MIEAGNKVMLNWTASDDRQIVKQKILYSPAGNARSSFHIIADNLPPTQREYELLVPTTGFEVSGSQAFVRVVAFDDKGQEGWDEWRALTPAGQEPGVLQITSNVAGQTFIGSQRTMPLTWTVTVPFQNTDFVGYILLDADRQLISVGGGQNGQTFLPPKMPQVSTDSARFAVRVAGTTNRQKWFFSEPFAIRPDSRYIDAAPQITMTSPAAGQEFPAGSIVPITWTASDDEALRQFDIQVSTDGGRTWILIADTLPPAATRFDWQTPFGGGANDVRIRVIAVDRRFQNSSDGANRVFRLTSPPNSAPSVQLTFPGDGASYTIGQALFVSADASDSDGTIQRVEFYETTSQFGPTNTKFIGADATPPYQIGWTYPNAQTHTITARVIDNRNAATTSAPVNITVQTVPFAPLPVGLPELTNPVDGVRFGPGQNITLNALPSPSSYSTVRVEFYNGTTLMASDNIAPYEIVWNKVPAGRYTVFSKTIASNGAEAISKPADISVGIGGSPIPTSIVSRKTHGSAGALDINLPLTGNAGIECRSGGSGGEHQVILAFPTAVTVGGVSVTSSDGLATATRSVTNQVVTLDLHNVTNAQTITILLTNVSDGTITGDFSIPMSVLLGDTNGDRSVNAGDALQTRSRSGQASEASNFRSDVNADGFVNSGDTVIIRAGSGSSLP